MVFWFSYIHDFITKPFESLLIEKHAIPSPTGVDAVRVTSQTPLPILTEIREYVRNYFGNPPHTPILDIPESHLLGKTDYFFLAREKGGRLVGTIRYRYVGELMVNENDPSIHRVDAFCIHPEWRKRGVGDYLLTELQRYATANGQPFAMFLKEGFYLPIAHTPLYSGQYVFRRIHAQQANPHVRILSTKQAHRFIDVYHRIYPQVCIIRNEKGLGQQWRLYKKGFHMIVACFQDTYQRIDKEKRGHMGWCTAWLESSVVTEEIREEAAIALTNTLPLFDYVWMNKRWTGKNSLDWTLCSNRAYYPIKNGTWIDDGTFHWYTYQWSTNIAMDISMCLLD
jgi:GNAT superfamily N-acetyltransferase